MGIRNNSYSSLNRMCEDVPQTYGRASSMRRQAVQKSLPTDLIFCDEYTGDVFQLSYNGATQFLKKMQINPCRENVEWLIDGLLNTSIDETFPMEGAELSIGCSCSYDPQGRSLAQMGVAKSMVCKEPSMPPAQYQRMQKIDGAGQRMTEAQLFMKKCGMPVGDGKGVLFGRNVIELSNALRKGTAGDGSYVGHDDIADVGGLVGHVSEKKKRFIPQGSGWQE